MAITDLVVTGFETSEALFQSASANWTIGAYQRTGSQGGRASASAASCYGQQTITGNTKVVGRFYWRMPSGLPSGGSGISYIGSLREGTAGVFQLELSNAGVITFRTGGGSVTGGGDVTGPTITDSDWHLVEVRADHSTSSVTWEVKIDSTSYGTATGTGTSANIDAARLGDGLAAGTPSRTFDYDDVAFGAWTAAGDWYGPLGGATQEIAPDADVTTTGWSTTPLWSKLSDDSDATVITATLA